MDELCGNVLVWMDGQRSFFCLKLINHAGPHEWHNDSEYANDVRINWEPRKVKDGD
jgi:hypothetical protein